MAQQINLFNPVFLKQKKYFSATTMLQALALLLGGILAFYGYAVHETRALAGAAKESSNQLTIQSQQLILFTRDYSPQGTSRLLADEVARLTLRLKQGEEMLSSLRTGGLGNTAGFARYLAAFARQSVAGVWLTALSIGGDESELLVSGRVLYPDLVPVYIRALNNEAVMRGRRVSELRLTAREHQDAPVTAAPGGTPAAGANPAAEPSRYVEFNLTASRGAATGTAAANSPAAGPATAGTATANVPAAGAAAAVIDALQGSKGNQ